MRTHVQDRMTEQQLKDLVERKRTVRSLAKELNVTENYLCKAVQKDKKRPVTNTPLLRASRRLYQDQIARETINGRHTVARGADLAHVSERTFYRRLSKLRANG